jgi:hypothetical protein
MILGETVKNKYGTWRLFCNLKDRSLKLTVFFLKTTDLTSTATNHGQPVPQHLLLFIFLLPTGYFILE